MTLQTGSYITLYLYKYKKNKTSKNLQKFKSLRSKIKNKIRISKEKYLSIIEANIVSNPSNIWPYVRSLKENNNSTNVLLIEGKEVVKLL